MSRSAAAPSGPHLEATSRHLVRWALTFEARAERPPNAVLPPLPDAEAAVIDAVVQDSPVYVRRLVLPWYCSHTPPAQIAEERGVSRSAIYDERRMVLAYLLGRLTEAGIDLPILGL